jgi:hypothetical protein
MSTGGTTNKPSKSLIMRVLFFRKHSGVPNGVPNQKKLSLLNEKILTVRLWIIKSFGLGKL